MVLTTSIIKPSLVGVLARAGNLLPRYVSAIKNVYFIRAVPGNGIVTSTRAASLCVRSHRPPPTAHRPPATGHRSFNFIQASSLVNPVIPGMHLSYSSFGFPVTRTTDPLFQLLLSSPSVKRTFTRHAPPLTEHERRNRREQNSSLEYIIIQRRA